MHPSFIHSPLPGNKHPKEKITDFQHPRLVIRPNSLLPGLQKQNQRRERRETAEDTDSETESVALSAGEINDIDEKDEITFIESMVQECRFLPPGEFLRRLKPASFERWKKYNENASVLDDQFNENKEKIFNEKLNVLLEELAAAQNGTHEELRAQFNQLEQQCLCELEKIKAIENLKTDCVNIRYEHERRAAQEGLEMEKRNMHNAWKSLTVEQRSLGSLQPGDDDGRSKKRRKKDRAFTVGEILRDKIGMVNAVANRRFTMDRMKEADRLTNMLQNRNEAELDGDILAIRKKITEATLASIDGSYQRTAAFSSPRTQY